nr:MAG TPA: hypothetical protein [Caudoviricetes sp.]
MLFSISTEHLPYSWTAGFSNDRKFINGRQVI